LSLLQDLYSHGDDGSGQVRALEAHCSWVRRGL
jgi:hypothetical protein